VNSVSLPALFQTPTRQYVYVWLAPYGSYDARIDTMLSAGQYLVSRLYPPSGDATFSRWNQAAQHFAPVNATVELDTPSWGGGNANLTSLNAAFDSVTASGGIYHLMWHPQTIYKDLHAPFVVGHLSHISRRNDLWYANFGHIYLYHLIASGVTTTSVIAVSGEPATCELQQNYPNPFNPSTEIRYSLAKSAMVTLKIYDILGREVVTLVDQFQSPGTYVARLEPAAGKQLATGVYFYRIESGAFSDVKKMMLLK
jgi:hypothetical protein